MEILMKNTYEQLIEYIINEQDDKARELFHQLVVEKSRDIYENLMDEADMDMGDENQVDSLVDEISADENGMGDEDGEMSDDDLAADDQDMDMDMEEESVEDRIMNLEDELDRLVAKFDELSSAEEAEEENEPGIHDSDFDSEDEEVEAEEEDEEVEEAYESDDDMETESFMREYVEKVTMPSNKTEGGAVGSSGQGTAVNKQSIVAKANKMGGTAQNIVTGGSEQNPTGATKPKNVYAKGETTLPGAGQFQNVPGAKTKGYATKSTSYEKQHGKEGQTTDGKLPVTGKSVVGGKVR